MYCTRTIKKKAYRTRTITKKGVPYLCAVPNCHPLFWLLEKTSNDCDPDFNRTVVTLSRFFRPKRGDLQKK